MSYPNQMQQQQPYGQSSLRPNRMVETLELSASSQRQFQQHQAQLLEMETKQMAATMHVPTLPEQVRAALRALGLPVRLFGENLANVRDRLKLELARRRVTADRFDEGGEDDRGRVPVGDDAEEEITKYTVASAALIEARQAMATFSIQRAAARLERERRWKALAVKRKRSRSQLSSSQAVNSPDDDHDDKKMDHNATKETDTKPQADVASELTKMDHRATNLFRSLRKVALEGSQYGDTRALSCLGTVHVAGTPVVVTACWNASVHLWDGSSAVLSKLGERKLCHQDRIMGLAVESVDNEQGLLATASIDMTAKLWKITKSHGVDEVMTESDDDTNKIQSEPAYAFRLEEQAHLKGHAARLCRTAFHPMKRHVATTSFDHSWRLWDVETGQCLLLQDGHWKECYGVGFHPDGSLVSTTDFGGVVQVWDLRTGKSVTTFLGHAQRVLHAAFHMNGFQLVTAGDDGTIKIWDLRRRKLAANVPAHSRLVTSLSMDGTTGECLATSSFDGTVKIWSCRSWSMLNELHGHEGKVSGVDLFSTTSGGRQEPRVSVVTCGFDKTLKLWR